MDDHLIFRVELAIKYPTHGTALWEPDPGGLYDAVQVGDVGLIRRGCFYRLFNALLPRDHSSDPDSHHGPSYPPQLQPRTVRTPTHIRKSRDYQKDFPSRGFREPNLEASEPDDDKVVTFSNHFGERKGALISLPFPAEREDTLAHGDFSKWIVKNIDDCMKLAEDFGGGFTARMEDIILVTGRHLAKSWVNAISPATGINLLGTQVSFGVQASGSGVHFEEGNVSGAVLKLGPTGENLPENQCIFVRGYRAVRTMNIRPRLQELAGPNLDIHGPDPEPDEHPKPSTAPAGAIQLVKYKPEEPLHVLLEYIAERSPDCDFALVHDDDLEFLNNAPPNIMWGTNNLKQFFQKHAPGIRQVHCEISPSSKLESASGAKVRSATVATLSNVVFGDEPPQSSG